MAEFKTVFICLLLVFCAVAEDEAQEKASKPIMFSLASARASGRELTTVEMLVDAYINLLDIMSKDDEAPKSYDEEDMLRQFSEYDNPYVADIIKAFEENKPAEQGIQSVERLAKILEDHFTDQGFEPEEHRAVLDRHEMFGKVSTRLVPPQKTVFSKPTAPGKPSTPGRKGGEL